MISDASQKGFESASPLSLAHSGQMAVVQKNDRAGLEGGCDFANDSRGVMWNAVVAGDRPTRELQAQFPGGEVDEGIRHPNGGTEPGRLLSVRIAYRRGTTGDFASRPGQASGPESGGGMAEGVVLHQVALVAHPAAKLRVGDGFFSNHKKLRPNPLAGEHIEELGSLAGIRTIIDRQAGLRALRCEARFHRAKPSAVAHHSGKNQHPSEKGSCEILPSHAENERRIRQILSPSRPRRSRK